MSFSSSSPQADLALPKGSLILVTGATSYVASHVIREALELGYCVRGTVRSKEKAALIEEAIGSTNFSTCVVEDLADPNSLKEAVKDCQGIIHMASVTTLDPDPTKVIPPTVAMATGILKAAKKAGACKRFVFTGSAAAAWIPKPDTEFAIKKDTWNTASVEKVRAMEPPYKPEGFYDVYAASKVEAEQAVWKFVEEEKPDFVVNSVIPNTNIGRVLRKPASSSANFALLVLKGGIQRIASVPPQWMINTGDDAKIHLAALIDQTVASERIFAFAQPFDWNDMLEAVRKARPNASLSEPLAPHGKDISTVDNELGAQLLRKWYNQDGYKLLDESVAENLEGVAEAEGEKQ